MLAFGKSELLFPWLVLPPRARACRQEGKRTGEAADLRLLKLWRHLVVAFKEAAQTYKPYRRGKSV